MIDIPSNDVVFGPNKPELLPCPFCNSKPMLRVTERRCDDEGMYEHPLIWYDVYCPCCGVKTIKSELRDTPIRRWNMRFNVGEE